MSQRFETYKTYDIVRFSFKNCQLKSASSAVANYSSTTQQKKGKFFKILKSPDVQFGSDQPYNYTIRTF